MSEVFTPLVARPLDTGDAAAFAQLCAGDPFRYLTPRLNLEVFGYTSQAVRAWGAFAPGETEMAGVMLRYSNTAILADADGATAEAFAPIIDGEQGLAGVRGSIEAVHKLRGRLRRYSPTGMEISIFMTLHAPPVCPQDLLSRARRAYPEDLHLLAALYADAWTMYRSRNNVASKLAETRVFVVEEPADERDSRRIVSCALLNVEGSDAALIGGVFTLPAARGRGYAAACTAALSIDLQRDGKLPCLFYENPVAGRVYRRLGFVEREQWGVLYIRGQ